MADDYGGLAPPSSSSTHLPAADAIGGDTVEEEGAWAMDRRRKLGPTGNAESHYQSADAARAAADAGQSGGDDKSAANASMFFSEASVSDREEWDGAVTEDDTLRGIDVDIIGRSPSRTRATPSPHALLSSPGESPGNTSLSSSNLSPHQRRYRPTRDLGLGPEMLVPTLGVPVADRSHGRSNGGITGIRSTVPTTMSKMQRSTITAKSNATKSDGDSNQVVEGLSSLSAPSAATAVAATPSSSDPEKDMTATNRAGVGVSHSFLPNYGDMAAAMATKGHRRKRSWSSGGQPAPIHRRTRSGDGKAAGLLTGGMDWKGMELDKLPLPDPTPLDKANKSSTKDGPSGGGGGPGNRKAAADARKMIEARYGTALMQRSISNKSMGYSETDDSEQEGQTTGKGRAPLPMPPPSGSARPFSPGSNADMSEDTHESTHSLFSWISGRFSAVSGRSKSGIARLRQSGRSKGRDSSIAFGSSGATSLSAGTFDASSFSPTTSNGPTSGGNGLPAREQEFGETAPLLERKDESIHSSNRTDTDEVASFSDPDEDLFRQRKVMTQIGGTERESPDIGRPSMAAAPPFARTKSNLSRPSFAVLEHEADKYPTFICPNCNTRQRNFFTVSSAPAQFESPAGYLAFYMAIYVVSSLFIFGLEEGWPAMDCVYFAVITLTTAGLGDYVPSTDGAKIICSIFIYFGVACIGLLLGSLLASGLDDASRKRAKETMVDNCPNCARIEAQSRNESKRSLLSAHGGLNEQRTWYSERSHEGSVPSGAPNVAPNGPPLHKLNDDRRKIRFDGISPSSGKGDVFSAQMPSPPGRQGPHVDLQAQPVYANEATSLGYNQSWSQQQQQRQNHNPFEYSPSPAIQNSGYMQYGHNVSPLPSNVMPRQTHTRHMSFDVQNVANGPVFPALAGNRSRNFSMDVPGQPVVRTIPAAPTPDNTEYAQIGGVDGDDYSYSTASSSESGESSYSSSSDSEYDPMVPLSKVQSAKYVFLTLRQALANSVFIIAIGGFGFFFIERMTAVDAFYFTTVLLTTVGYGDIVPQTSEGKMFATVYILIAGTVLLHNMSMISMIPIELRKRRVERAVLRQFGNQLDDSALRELATGPLVKRLALSTSRADGLDECTREMFALAMLVRLGRISEQDVRSTFSAFRRLDVDDDGKLNSRDIIMGEFHRRQNILRQSRSQADLQAAAAVEDVGIEIVGSPENGV